MEAEHLSEVAGGRIKHIPAAVASHTISSGPLMDEGRYKLSGYLSLPTVDGPAASMSMVPGSICPLPLVRSRPLCGSASA
jgi:hypothetical protein